MKKFFFLRKYMNKKLVGSQLVEYISLVLLILLIVVLVKPKLQEFFSALVDNITEKSKTVIEL